MRDSIKLGEIFKYKKGIKPKFLVEDIIEFGLPYLTAKYFRENKPEAYTYKADGNKFVHADNNDIILIWDGSNAGDVFRGLSGALASTMIKFEKSEKVLDEFLYYFLKTQFSILNSKTTGSTIPHVSKNILDNLEIPYYSLSEQSKIVYVLRTIHKAIEQQDKLIKTTTELKKALMQKLFSEGTKGVKQKQTEIGLVPESWEAVKLGECIIKTQYGLSTKGSDKGNIPILRMTNQKDGYIVPDSLQYVNISSSEVNKFKIDFEDIIFNRTNSFELVGRTAIFQLEDNYVFASYLIRLKTDRTKLLPRFLNTYFNTDETQLRLKSIATRGVSQSNISATRLIGFTIPLPPISEQYEIVEISERFDRKIKFHQSKKYSLTNLFKTLLHELMTGQRRVNEIDFELTGKEYQIAEQPLSVAAEN